MFVWTIGFASSRNAFLASLQGHLLVFFDHVHEYNVADSFLDHLNTLPHTSIVFISNSLARWKIDTVRALCPQRQFQFHLAELDRPHVSVRVVHSPDPANMRLASYLTPANLGFGPDGNRRKAIVFWPEDLDLEMARSELRALGSVGYLHEELGAITYSAVLKDFINGRLWLLVAHRLPSGLDLQNIGLVVHYGNPKSLSKYHGEIGHLARYHYSAEDYDANPSVFAAKSLIIAVPPPLPHPDEHLEGAAASNVQPIQHIEELEMGVVLRCAAQGDCIRRQLLRHWGLATFKGCAESGGFECSSCYPTDVLGPE